MSSVRLKRRRRQPVTFPVGDEMNGTEGTKTVCPREYVEIVVLIGTSSIWKLQFRFDFRHLINP